MALQLKIRKLVSQMTMEELEVRKILILQFLRTSVDCCLYYYFL